MGGWDDAVMGWIERGVPMRGKAKVTNEKDEECDRWRDEREKCVGSSKGRECVNAASKGPGLGEGKGGYMRRSWSSRVKS